MKDPTPVRRCVCMDVTFEQMRESRLGSLSEISAKLGCGSKCGCCSPYIQLMLETGRTAFSVDDAIVDCVH